MKNAIIYCSTFAAWCMAVLYDQIEKVSGMEITALLVAAIITMVGGLYFGLNAKTN